MTVKHILNEQLLMGYAAGILPEAFDLVVATHLSLSDESRAMLCSFESLGGCVLNRCEEARMASDALDKTLDKIKCSNPKTSAKGTCCGCLPEPLRRYVGGGIEAVKWSALGADAKQAVLPVGQDATARLLYIPAGQTLPHHGLRSQELTLVLKGAFNDGLFRYARGDIKIVNEKAEHQPIADLGEVCICLTATDTPQG